VAVAVERLIGQVQLVLVDQAVAAVFTPQMLFQFRDPFQ
jgi:hypothetical protein